MNQKLLRITLILLTGFIALTAMGGGIAILIEVDNFPLEWLRDTPFTDYTVPALILAILVGGSSLVAALTNILRARSASYSSIVAGLMMTVYIVVEFLILKQTPPGPTTIEIFYAVLGVAIIGLGAMLNVVQNRG